MRTGEASPPVGRPNLGLGGISTCRLYCALHGLSCIAQYDDGADSCMKKSNPGSCDFEDFQTTDHVCRCGAASGFVLRKRGESPECTNASGTARSTFLGQHSTARTCAGACRAHVGCTRFAYGTGADAGACWSMSVPSTAGCIQVDEYDLDLDQHGAFRRIGNG